jgi:hypothetical protein
MLAVAERALAAADADALASEADATEALALIPASSPKPVVARTNDCQLSASPDVPPRTQDLPCPAVAPLSSASASRTWTSQDSVNQPALMSASRDIRSRTFSSAISTPP